MNLQVSNKLDHPYPLYIPEELHFPHDRLAFTTYVRTHTPQNGTIEVQSAPHNGSILS